MKIDPQCEGKKGIKELRTQVWSTTFIGGVFDPNRKRLVIWNCGDSGALVMGNEPVAPNNRVMLLARLEIRDSLHVCVKRVLGSSEILGKVFDAVEGFVAMSDGVVRGKLSEYLFRLNKQPFPSVWSLRETLLRNADELTWDDKSVIFGRFL